MNREENSDSIPFPTDLFFEIFSRLPAKSIGKFCCVSKQWRSMLHSPDFTDLFFTKSSARPRLLFGLEQDAYGERFFFSSPQPNSSSLDFHTKFGYIAYADSVHHILTLGSGNMKWRNVQCPFTHEPFHERICINGREYYLAQPDGYPCPYMIVCFDVRSEEFKFIDTERFCNMCTKLVNYKGKLGAVNYDSGMRNLKLRIWVLEDVEKQEWSNFVYTLPENEVLDSCDLSVVGVTASGEIVLSKQFTCKPFYVFYFNPERNTLQRVEIHGNHQVFENRNRVDVFVDHVEDLKFDIMRAATSISPPEQMSTSTRKDHQNEKAITEEVANGSLYKEVDKSCKVISGRLSRGSGCLKGTAITAVVVAAAGAVAAVVLSSNPEATTELINLVDSYVNVIITALKN
ncbi:F-box protein [Cardamine amara subsp. amara]|uniref:F-box protein n=1 Tax=Cardamine amara subsp. amara TaxID=228776 RepID=A0ABD0ZHP1_CARAN